MSVRITDHALIRYIERVGGVDLSPIRNAMISGRLKNAIKMKARAVVVDGFIYRLAKDGTVLTVIPLSEASVTDRADANKKRGYA